MTALFIDDDKDTNFLIDLLIRDLPYIQEYHIMDKAKEALHFLKSYDKPLSCIFVDIKMPEMDGFEFVEQYEKDFHTKYPTSSIRETDRSRAMEFEVVQGVIIKPLTRSILTEINEKLKSGA